MSEIIDAQTLTTIDLIKILAGSAFAGVEYDSVEPHVPETDDLCIETIAGVSRSTTGFDAAADCIVDVTETIGMYQDPDGDGVDAHDLWFEWEDGEHATVNLDAGIICKDGKVLNGKKAQKLANKMLSAMEAVIPPSS